MRCGPPGGRSNQRSRAAAIVSRLARYNRLAAASRQALAPRGRPTPWRFSGGAQRRPLQVMGWTPRFSGYVDHVQSWVDIITEGGDLMSTTIAVDLAKSVFEVAVSDTPGRVRIRRRLTRAASHRAARSLRLRALLGPPRTCRRARRPPAPATRRASLRAAQQDRPRRREGPARSRAQRGHSRRPYGSSLPGRGGCKVR
jgi:hypothetical protein